MQIIDLTEKHYAPYFCCLADWSDEMKEAWVEIKAHPRVKVSIDLFSMGLAFFREGIVKQDFRIKF